MRCARLQYVTESFNSSSLFHKALKEAFEAFCNKAVGGLASAELMANFCNTLLSKTVGLSILAPFHMCCAACAVIDCRRTSSACQQLSRQLYSINMSPIAEPESTYC